VPQATRIGILWNPTTPSHPKVVKAIEAAARSLGVGLLMTPIQAVADFDGAFSTMAAERVDGFLVPGSPLANAQRAPLADLALKHRLPGIFANKANVRAGGLMSYGADFNYMYRHAALYVTKFSREKSLRSCLSNRRPSMSFSSTSRPPGRLASRYRRRCSPAPTRWSNKVALAAVMALRARTERPAFPAPSDL